MAVSPQHRPSTTNSHRPGGAAARRINQHIQNRPSSPTLHQPSQTALKRPQAAVVRRTSRFHPPTTKRASSPPIPPTKSKKKKKENGTQHNTNPPHPPPRTPQPHPLISALPGLVPPPRHLPPLRLPHPGTPTRFTTRLAAPPRSRKGPVGPQAQPARLRALRAPAARDALHGQGKELEERSVAGVR